VDRIPGILRNLAEIAGDYYCDANSLWAVSSQLAVAPLLLKIKPQCEKEGVESNHLYQLGLAYVRSNSSQHRPS